MKPLIVRVGSNLTVVNNTINQLLELFKIPENKGDFTGEVSMQLMYVSGLVSRAFKECDVLVCHLKNGMRVAFVKDAVNKPEFENPIIIQHMQLDFFDGMKP